MTRVGVMTFLHNDNYGSMLQAWALQQTLMELGFDAEHINYAPSLTEKVRNLLTSGNSPRLILEGMRKKSATGKMHGGFAQFRQEHMRLSQVCPDAAALRRQAESYDVLLCGSDQIWSPVWLNPAYFLNFSSKPRVAYAPSFGVAEITSRRKERRIAGLVRPFHAVSVREPHCQDAVQHMTGKHCPVMPDPVFLQPREKWLQMMDHDVPEKPYILCYFIGENPLYWQRVRDAADREGLEVRVIPRTEEARNAGYLLEEDVPVRRWLGLIAHAALVVTDSFHGAAFSSILNVRCSIIRRYREDDPQSKNSRIEQLLHMLQVEDLEHGAWEQINHAIACLAEEARCWLDASITSAASSAAPARGK